MALAGALAALAFNIGEDALALGELGEIAGLDVVDVLSALAPLPGVQTFAGDWLAEHTRRQKVDYTPLILGVGILIISLL